MTDLLESINLSDRIVREATEIKEFNFNINYEEANFLLRRIRQDSIDYLKDSLNIKEA
jgi:hypothetical protein